MVRSFTVGRNDPCVCGSGLKYKKCCLLTKPSGTVMDFSWRRMRQAEGEIIDNHLLPFLRKVIPLGVLQAVKADFAQKAALPPEEEALLLHAMFTPWELFDWIPDDGEGLMEHVPEAYRHKPIAASYLERFAQRLTAYQRAFIKGMLDTYYSFYVVMEVVPEMHLKLKDIFLGTEHLVKERQGTRFLKRGCIVFTRILTLEDQAICVGMSPFIIAPNKHLDLLDRRDHMQKFIGGPLTQGHLQSIFAEAMFSLCLTIVQQQINNPFPKLVNTDGEDIVFCKVRGTLTISPQETLEKLYTLSLSKTPEDALEISHYDREGQLKKAQFSWMKRSNKIHKNWENTVLGTIRITKTKVEVEVNSKERAEKAQDLLEKHLKGGIVSIKTSANSVERVLASAPKKPQIPSVSRVSQKPERITPEHQEIVRKWIQDHYKRWLDDPLPVLHGLTPRKAAQTKEGQERLEALLLDLEQRNPDHPEESGWVDIPGLKRELGM